MQHDQKSHAPKGHNDPKLEDQRTRRRLLVDMGAAALLTAGAMSLAR